MKLFIALLENVNKSRTSAGSISLKRSRSKQEKKTVLSCSRQSGNGK
jgi:hypothetical protein